jgi:serine/threonine protein kinase
MLTRPSSSWLTHSEDSLRYDLNCYGGRAHPRRRLSLRQRAELALGAVKGLAFLHDRNIVHFDVKPENLLLEHTNMSPEICWNGRPLDWEMPTVKVADFGLSKRLETDNVEFRELRYAT